MDFTINKIISEAEFAGLKDNALNNPFVIIHIWTLVLIIFILAQCTKKRLNLLCVLTYVLLETLSGLKGSVS